MKIIFFPNPLKTGKPADLASIYEFSFQFIHNIPPFEPNTKVAGGYSNLENFSKTPDTLTKVRRITKHNLSA